RARAVVFFQFSKSLSLAPKELRGRLFHDPIRSIRGEKAQRLTAVESKVGDTEHSFNEHLICTLAPCPGPWGKRPRGKQ
ncbi:unnamed protein product, partial [Gulo gulo]